MGEEANQSELTGPSISRFTAEEKSQEREGHVVMTKVIWSKFSMVCVFDGLVKVKCGS